MSDFTPWCRAALSAAGVTPREAASLAPRGWDMTGYARSSGGPFTFRLRERATGRELVTVANSIADVADAVDRLTGANALEEQLAASLAARGIG